MQRSHDADDEEIMRSHDADDEEVITMFSADWETDVANPLQAAKRRQIQENLTVTSDPMEQTPLLQQHDKPMSTSTSVDTPGINVENARNGIRNSGSEPRRQFGTPTRYYDKQYCSIERSKGIG
jgi:C4-dicarboxylate-specific signal transduction histidine kinase